MLIKSQEYLNVAFQLKAEALGLAIESVPKLHDYLDYQKIGDLVRVDSKERKKHVALFGEKSEMRPMEEIRISCQIKGGIYDAHFAILFSNTDHYSFEDVTRTGLLCECCPVAFVEDMNEDFFNKLLSKRLSKQESKGRNEDQIRAISEANDIEIKAKNARIRASQFKSEAERLNDMWGDVWNKLNQGGEVTSSPDFLSVDVDKMHKGLEPGDIAKLGGYEVQVVRRVDVPPVEQPRLGLEGMRVRIGTYVFKRAY